MSGLKWTKTYDLRAKDKHFHVFVSDHDGNGFYASCLWYGPGRVLKVPGESGSLEFKVETRFAVSEAEAFDLIIGWAKNKFGDDLRWQRSGGE